MPWSNRGDTGCKLSDTPIKVTLNFKIDISVVEWPFTALKLEMAGYFHAE
ncbi:hypothetical protein RvY_00138 [Ramazzottius varieornatus]|uniref:Uncharacterized protein n=1 Tax=Ramazzottius varieornatus TaxID=947166 RepID=A0A1D1UM90_RAMVA|nr:hypothetical protein RvY_00138 [Ramazzottius varieornatus]